MPRKLVGGLIMAVVVPVYEKDMPGVLYVKL